MKFAPGTSRPDTARRAATGMRTLRTADLLVLSIGTFTLGVDGFVLSGLLPQVAASLHVSASAAGQLTTLFALVYAVGSPVIAALAGAWDRRALLTAGMAVFVLGVVLQATGPDFASSRAGRSRRSAPPRRPSAARDRPCRVEATAQNLAVDSAVRGAAMRSCLPGLAGDDAVAWWPVACLAVRTHQPASRCGTILV